MERVVAVLQIVCGLAWFAEAMLLMPGALRVWRKQGDALDAGRMPIMVFSLVQAGFSARWFIWPRALEAMPMIELVFWGALYVLSTASAVFCIAAHAAVSRKMR